MRLIQNLTVCSSSIALVMGMAQTPLAAQTTPMPPEAAQAAQTTDAAPAAAGAVPAAAEAPQGDIVVTANRRSESISRVPISVTAFGQTKMDTLSVKEVGDIGRISPGVTFREGFGQSTNISVRGITSTVGAATTGIYIDDTPIQARQMGTAQSATTTYPTIFDLDRVEVLRGPQGTLFGAGSEGGTVRFLTPAPSLTKYSVYARSELAFTEHGDPSYEGGVAVGGPIVQDRLGFRASAFYRRDGGWVDRTPYGGLARNDDNSNWGTTLALRGALTFAPTDDIKITPSIAYQRKFTHDTDLVWLNISNPDKGVYRNGFAAGQPFKDKYVLPSLKAEWNLGGVTLFSNTSYFDRHYPFQNDYSTFILDLLTPLSPGHTGPSFIAPGVPNYDPISYNFGSQKAFNQEIRLQSNSTTSRFNWVIGAFYQHSKQKFDQYVYDPQLGDVTQSLFGATPAQVLGAPLQLPYSGRVPQGAFYSLDGLETTLDKQIAGFGQADFQLFKGFKIIGGIRVARTTTSFSNSKNGPFNGGFNAESGTKKETPVTPKFGINYEPVAGQLFYATAAKGFRTGGANPAVTDLCGRDLTALGRSQVPSTYNSDSVWSYEVGTKNRFFGNKLRVEASAFYIDWKNIQQQVKLGTCGFDFIANVGKAVSKGFDLQATANPTPGLSLSGSVGYTHARFTENAYGGANQTGLLVSKGDPLPIPEWHVTAAADYEFSVREGLQAYLHGDYQYESGYQALPSAPSASNDPEIDHAMATHFASLRAGLRFQKIDASVFVKNLFDSTDNLYLTRYNLNSDLLKAAKFRPRTIGVTVSYRY